MHSLYKVEKERQKKEREFAMYKRFNPSMFTIFLKQKDFRKNIKTSKKERRRT